MANLPEKTEQSTELTPAERFQEAVADAIASGLTPGQVAKRLAPDDPAKRKQYRSRIRYLIYKDPAFAQRLALRARGQMLIDLVPAVSAAGQRARRGRMDAVKFLTEASGFHNPRVSHEHSGEIKVKLEIPRPTFDADVADADVVE